MRSLGPWTRSLRGAALLVAILVVVAFLGSEVGTASQERIVIGFFINLTVVLGLQMFTGNSGVVSLGHLSFMGVGAYVAAVLASPPAVKAAVIPEAPFGLTDVEMASPLVVIAALAVTGVVALVSGLAVTRQVGISATIVSLALLVVVHNVLLNWVDVTRGARAFYGVPIKTSITSALAMAVVAVVVARLFRDSTSGLQLRAGGEDSLAAASMGVGVRRLRLLSWVLGALLVGVAGVAYAYFLGTISPDAFYFHATFLTLAMLLLGGMRSVSGAVVGAIFVTVGYEVMRDLESGSELGGLTLPTLPGLADFFLGAVIVLVMILRPDGLIGDDEIDETVARRLGRRRLHQASLSPSGPAPAIEAVERGEA